MARAFVQPQRVSLAVLKEWAKLETLRPSAPRLVVEGPSGSVTFWVLEVPQNQPHVHGPDAYVTSITVAEVGLSRGFAFCSASETTPDADRGRRIALQRALEASGASRRDRMGFWLAYESLMGLRGSRKPTGAIEVPRVVVLEPRQQRSTLEPF